MATPVGVPLVRSSNFDCSQVRVPSANATAPKLSTVNTARNNPPERKKNRRRLCTLIPRLQIHRRDVVGNASFAEPQEFRLTRDAAQSRGLRRKRSEEHT